MEIIWNKKELFHLCQKHQVMSEISDILSHVVREACIAIFLYFKFKILVKNRKCSVATKRKIMPLKD